MSDTPYFTCVFQMQQCSYRCGPARVWTQGWMPQNTFPCVSVYTVAGECWKKLLNNKYPLLNALSIPSRWPRSTDGARAFDEHTLCINLDCRKRSFQAFDDLHLPVILSNNFSIYLSLIPPLLLPNEATSSSELRLVVGARYLVTVFHVRLSCLVLSSALYKQAGCGCACGHVLSTSEGQLWGSSFSLTYNTDGNIQDLFQPLVSCLSRQHCCTIVIFPQMLFPNTGDKVMLSYKITLVMIKNSIVCIIQGQGNPTMHCNMIK